eukprot:Em0024g180a
MPLHVMASFGGFPCECGLERYVSLLIMHVCVILGIAFVMQYISPINLLKASLVYGRELKHDGTNKTISRDKSRSTWGPLSQGLWFFGYHKWSILLRSKPKATTAPTSPSLEVTLS